MSLRQTKEEILTQLRTVKDGIWCAIWNSQIDRMEDSSGLTLPQEGLYLEMLETEWQPLAIGFSAADIIWRIHILHTQLDAGDGTFDQNLDVYDLRDAVKNKLTLFRPKGCGSWIANGESVDTAHTNVYHYTLDFKCHFIDSVGSPLDPVYGTWIESVPPTDLVVNYQEVVNDIFSDEFSDEFS